MSDLEADLRNLLGRRAAAAPPSSGDWQDLTVRMARRNRHSRRMLAGALALVLIVGPLAGFAAARVVDESDPSGRITAGGPSSAGARDGIATAGSIGRVAIGSEIGMAGGIALDPKFRRTTADGIAVRGFRANYGDSGGTSCDGNGWCPPPECFPDGLIVGQLSTDQAVGTAHGDHYSEISGAVRVMANGTFGADGEGSPARWVIAQVGDGVAAVRVEFEGGGRDEMEPVDGIVVLAALTDTAKSGGTVEALDASGASVGEADATEHAVALDRMTVLGTEGSARAVALAPGSGSAPSPVPPDLPTSFTAPASPGACTPPPPPLPPPGEQPADPGGARAEIERAFTVAYDGGLGGTEEQRAVVEDGAGLEAVMDEVRSGTFAAQVKDASAKVTEIVFTSPTEAAVRYDIEIANYTNFRDRVGQARLVDGRWLITRATVCQDIELAGGPCPPG